MQTRKKSARRGLLVSATSLLLSVAMLVGTTFAWFTDSVSSGTNKIQAGNLDIELSHKTGSMRNWEDVTGSTILFQGQDEDNTRWEPGAVVYENFKIKNAGSLALKYVLDFKELGSGDFNTVVEADGEITNRSLKDVLYCAIQDETVTNVRPDMSKNDGKLLSEILNDPTDIEQGEDPYIQMSSLEPGAEKQLSIIVYWPRDLRNDIDNQYNLNNGKYASGEGTNAANPGKLFINLGLDLDATQYEAENDSFGNDYDKNADGTNKYNGTVQSASVTGTVDAATNKLTLTAPVAPATDNGSTQTTTVTIDGGLSDAGNYTLTTETSDLLANQSTAAPTEGSIVASVGTESASTTPVAKIDLNLFDNTSNTKVFTSAGGNEATVTTYIAKGLSNVGVAYIGDSGDSPIVADSVSYDSETGKLTFKTKHFSEYCATGDATAYIQTTDKAYQSLSEAITGAPNNETVILLKDVPSGKQVYVKADKDVTLELNGHTYTKNSGNAPILNEGTLTIKDSVGTGAIVSTNNVPVVAYGTGSVTTILSGTFTGVEGAVCTGNATGATINIQGGTFSASDNAVVAGNGTKRAGEPNTVNISGGTFNGTIKTSGYVACGIYAPWKDNINVSGGTFNITGGAGIVARAGNVTVSGGEFNVTGTVTGKVGDSRVVVPCSALVFDSEANYPAMTADSKITVTGGSFTSEVSCINTVPDTDTGRVVVSAGTFSSDPSAYVAQGKIAIQNSEDRYEIVEGVRFTFDDPNEELDFCADCYNNPGTDHFAHNKYLNIGNGVAVVTRTGAWMAFENLDWENKTYVLEYDIDLSDLQDGAFVAFDSGETASWQDLQLGFKRDASGITAYNTVFTNDDTKKLGAIGNNVHATYTYSYSSADNCLTMTMVITGGTNPYTVEKKVNNFNTSPNLCWDVYTADGKSDIYAKLDNFTFKSLANQ